MKQKFNMLPVIAAFKLGKAILLFIVAFGFHDLRRGNAESIITGWVHAVRIDPESHYAHLFISGITGIPPAKLHDLGIGTFLYGLLFLTEGTGLMLQVRWAEYLTIVSTLGFLPLEIFELVEKPGHKYTKAVVLFLNILIAVYLILNLRKKRKAEG
jgi:uncharacterized membrane protein (DUF2068 family)